MSSLLTNNSAMVALQTLKTINKNMGEVQNEVSTGKRIANARDNAALWGISTTMQTDVSGFKAISESLSLGTATLTVGREAAETVASLLDQLKGKIVAAQEQNVDRGKIQADVDALVEQVQVVTRAAQFNGLNLLANNDPIEILASLNRDSFGNVTSDKITVTSQDLTTSTGVMGTTVSGAGTLEANVEVSTLDATTFDGTSGTGAIGAAGRASTISIAGAGNADDSSTISVTISDSSGDLMTFTTAAITNASGAAGAETAVMTAYGLQAPNEKFTITADAVGTGFVVTALEGFEDLTVAISYGGSVSTFNTGGLGAATAGSVVAQSRAEVIEFDKNALVQDGDGYQIDIDGTTYTYVAGQGEDMIDVVNGLKAAIDATNSTTLTTKVELDDTNYRLRIDSTANVTAITMAFATEGDATGGMFGLDKLSVLTDASATNALSSIEGLIQNAVSAAAEFGSIQGRIQTQSEFVSKIMDGLTSGIGALVDADMEAASARLQALQVQQQLGIQALSIANQQPQNILALFRQ